MIARGKEKGFLTYAEVNDHLPDDIVDPEQIEDIIAMINDMGIEVHEFVPDTETLLLNENPASADDDVVAEEAAAALAAVDSEFGRTTDPVRMYMREMGTVELLTREGEIQIAKRIEEGMGQVLSALANYPLTTSELLRIYDSISDNGTRLTDVISGFQDGEEAAPPISEEEMPLAADDPDAVVGEDEEDDEKRTRKRTRGRGRGRSKAWSKTARTPRKPPAVSRNCARFTTKLSPARTNSGCGTPKLRRCASSSASVSCNFGWCRRRSTS